MRCGYLSQRLCARGHEVVWWASSFSHSQKRFLYNSDQKIQVAPGYHVQFLHGPGYRSNVSLARVRSHVVRARAFRRLATQHEKPDLIVCALPTLELSEAAVEYGRDNNIPVVIDILDKWPDAYLYVFPRAFRPALRLVLHTEFFRARRICRHASALLACSYSFLQWGLNYAGRSQREFDGVYPLGYDPELGEPTPDGKAFLASIGIEEHHFVVAFVGGFGFTCDLDTVIRAAQQLHSTGDRKVLFVLAGHGSRADRWKNMARSLPNVVFPGWLSKQQIAGLLRRANAGLASYAPGAPQSLPNKPYEYFAGGLPVVSSLPGELQELLEREDVGLTYRAGDPTDLLRRVEYLAASPSIAEAMGRRARGLADGRLSLPGIADRMVDHFEALVTQFGLVWPPRRRSKGQGLLRC